MAAVVQLMRSQVQWIHSPDIDWANFAAEPSDKTTFSVLLQVIVAVEGEGHGGGDTFDIVVTTPLHMLECLTRDEEPQWGRHYLVVARWDRLAIERKIRHQFDGVEGKTWDDIAKVLSRYGHWEFEDYDD
jgi:hypothetical protein